MIYTKDWAFVHVPKTSGTNLKTRALEKYKDSNYIQTENSDIIGEMMHNPYVYWKNILKDRWVFSIIRNPFSRAVSLWKYCNEKRPAFRENFGYHSFYEFYTNKELKVWKDKSWGVQTPQFYFLKDHKNKITIDTFKIETDLNLLELKLGFEFTKSKHNSLEPYDYKKIYKDKKNISIIQEIFEIDFKIFKYDLSEI